MIDRQIEMKERLDLKKEIIKTHSDMNQLKNKIQKLNIHLQLNKIMIKQTFLRVKSYKITSNMTNIYFFRKITLNRAQK